MFLKVYELTGVHTCKYGQYLWYSYTFNVQIVMSSLKSILKGEDLSIQTTSHKVILKNFLFVHAIVKLF